MLRYHHSNEELRLQVKSLAYVQGFKCVGGSCPDSCCIGWDVDIDQVSYKKYQKFKPGELATIVKKHLYRNDRMYHPNVDYGKVKLKSNKWCPFLDNEKWCLIQKEHGEHALSNVCQSFPRIVNRINGEWEMSLTLSCPIAAKRLFSDEHEMTHISLSIDKEPKVTTFTHEDKSQTGIYSEVTVVRNRILNTLLKAESVSELVLEIENLLNVKKPFKRPLKGFSKKDSFKRAHAFYEALYKDHTLKNTRFYPYLKPLLSFNGLEAAEAQNFEPIILKYLKRYFYNDFFQNLFPYTEAETFEKSYFWFLGRLMMLHYGLEDALKQGFTTEEIVNYISAFSKGIEHHHTFKTHVIQTFMENKR